MNRRLPALLLAFLLAACASSVPRTQDRLAERIPLDPEVRRGTLPNGVTYYVRTNRKPENRAELRLAINAGSVLESDEQRGLAHFAEHMAFNGTESFEKQELVNYLERIGMRFGPDVNAYTSFDETVYMLQIPTDDPKIVDTAFHILHDWATAVTFAPDEVEKERGVVVEEWRLGRSASGRIRDKQFPVVFHGSKYAERLPIGIKETLENAPVEQLRNFYRHWYRPDLTGVIAVGDFDADRIEALIREQFGGIPAASDPPARTEFQIPDHNETLVSVVTDPEATSIGVRVEYKRPPVRRRTVGDLRQALVDALYHTMMNARLRELGQVENPPYLSAFAASGSLGRTKSTYRLSARVGNGGVERGLSTLLTEARRVETHGFTQTELERARISFLRNIERTYEDREKQESARFASQYVEHFLEGDAVPSIAYTRDVFNELLPGITLAEVNQRAGQWITDTNRVILVSGPEKQEARIPEEKQLLAVFADADRVAVTPWVDRVREEPLVAQEPEAGRIVEENEFAGVGVTRWRLSNGAVVLLKPTDFRNEQVLLRAWSPGGQSLAPDSIHFTASRAADIVAQMGAGRFDTTELGKALTGKAVSVSPFIGELSEGLRGAASPRDLETMFELLYLRMTAARSDDNAFAALTSRLRGQLENQEASPGFLFARKMNEVLTQDHPRRRFLTLADLDAIDVERALAFYRDRFADASDFVFTFVGNFDIATMRPLVEKWVAGLPATRRAESWRNVGVRQPAGVQTVNVEKGIEPRSSVRIVFHGPAKWSLAESHVIASLAAVLRIRLREELREDRGGVYGVGVGAFLSRHPEEEYSFSISFTADPERVQELIKAAFDEIDKIKVEGPSQDHVDRVREMQRRAREVELKQNGFWAYQLEFLATNDLDFNEVLQHDKRIEAITRDSIQAAANRYLDRTRYVLGVLHPEKQP
ncbi:MAG TPA: insulinase family protein [Thermoanaerobaculia bacterium]|nr:insulinase family protein [Thermoanaerobaculia bacterium]